MTELASLPPYNAFTVCEKCGATDGAKTQYMPKGTLCVHPDEVIVGGGGQERLHRECWRCSYQWDEAVLTVDA